MKKHNLTFVALKIIIPQITTVKSDTSAFFYWKRLKTYSDSISSIAIHTDEEMVQLKTIFLIKTLTPPKKNII
jgi:hypothetical protein